MKCIFFALYPSRRKKGKEKTEHLDRKCQLVVGVWRKKHNPESKENEMDMEELH